MTADHPTREERYAAVLAEHRWSVGRWARQVGGWWWRCSCGTNDWGTEAENPARYVGHCDERAAMVSAAAHVAAALVAADPAPAQRDAAWPCDNHGEPNTCLSLRKAEAECCRVCRIRAADRILHAAQPVPAPVDGSWVCGVCGEGGPAHGEHGVRRDCAYEPVFKPAPAPEVSRGVAEVKAEALREAADFLEGRLGIAGIPKTLWEFRQWLRARAESIAHPADDGADCCRERTTAGGCGCGRSGEGGGERG